MVALSHAPLQLVHNPVLKIVTIPFDRPIFILSAPRSGSSYFYEILRRSRDVRSFDKENDPLWFKFFPYSRSPLPSDYIAGKECPSATVRAFRTQLLLKALQASRTHRWQDRLQHVFLRKPLRYLEKTIANCFHLEALTRMFPDALYIHIVRDGRACISSMLEGWNSGFFWKRPLPFPADATIAHWTYPIPPGWQRVVHRPLPEICAWSWQEHNRYVLEKVKQDEVFQRNYIRISYEDLRADPDRAIEKVADFAGLTPTEESRQYINNKRPSWTTISQPKAGKWREKNPDAIAQIVPQIAPMMAELGYSL